MVDIDDSIRYNQTVIIKNGSHLKAWLDNQKLEQKQLAVLIGRSKFTVWKWVHDKIGIPPYLHIMLERVELDRKAQVEALKEKIADSRQVKLPLKGSIKTKKRK